MKIFITGVTGYIGSHTCVELLEQGFDVVGLDNFSNSKKEVLDNIFSLSGKKIDFYEGNMLDEALLEKIFTEHKIDVVIDFAAYKAVGDSVAKPVEYYINNVSSVLVLLSVMKKFDVKSIVFSSSATVYGDAKTMPITEDFPTGGTTNPYGTSKLYVEGILKDLYRSDSSYNICILRYFNPVGAHSSAMLGEDPKGTPANLMPFIAKVAAGELECLSVFGNDYDTKDGTGVRDYIHVVDLAEAHVKGVEKLIKEKQGLYIYNLGSGAGYSVLEMIEAFEKVNEVKVNYKIMDRRPGDVDMCYADSSLAWKELGWKAKLGIDDMCKDAYRYANKVNQQ